MTAFIPGGPPRFLHQRRGLQKYITTGGQAALLFDPGTGKTAVTIDYACILALKSARREARMLVIAPLAATDTWVIQMEKFASPQVSWWAEVLGGSMLQKAEALASRGGQPYKRPLGNPRPTPPSFIHRDSSADGGYVWSCTRCTESGLYDTAKVCDAAWAKHVKEGHPEYRPRPPKAKPPHGPRALHHELSDTWAARRPEVFEVPWLEYMPETEGRIQRGLAPAELAAREEEYRDKVVKLPRPPITASEGPDGLGDALPRVVVEIINIDPLARRDELGSKNMADQFVDAIKRFGPDLVVIDEGHKIKSAGGNASRLAARVTNFAKRRGLLTGTAMPLGPMDVFAEWRFLEPYAFGTLDEHGVRKKATYGDFQERFGKFGGFYGKEVRGYKNLDEMQTIMAKNAVVARKIECLDLPPVMPPIIVPVHLSQAEQQAYLAMKSAMAVDLVNGGQASVSSVLTQGMRLRQITSGHLPADDGTMTVLGRSKVDVITSIANDTLAGEKRIVIFCLFSYEIAMLKAVLSRQVKDAGPTEVMVIEGSTPNEERKAMRARFGSDAPERIVMIAQIKTMSVAVNELVTASHAIFGSLSQQRDDLIQAMARLDRIGQTRPVTFWIALAPGTVDEVIWKSHEDRTSLENAMLHHIQQDGLSASTIPGQG